MDKDERTGWQLSDQLGQISSDVKGYVRTQSELLKLELAEKAGRTASKTIFGLVVLLLFVVAFVFASIALAIWLGDRCEDMALGFLIVAGIYVLLLVVFYFLWKYVLSERVQLNIMNELYFKSDENEPIQNTEGFSRREDSPA